MKIVGSRTFAFGLLMASLPYAAQAIPPFALPPTAEPGPTQQRFQDLPRPSVGGAPVVATPADQGIKEMKTDVNFTLKQVKIEGASTFDEAQLMPLYAGKIGQEASLNTLNRIAADITAYYRNKGYILTRALVPVQKIQSGVVTIRVLEGFVSEVKLEGELKDSRAIKAYAEKIKAAKPLDAATLERYLLLMEDLPGVEARAVLQPSANAPGGSDVIVTIARRTFQASASLDNRGSRFLGPYQGTLTGAANDVLGLDEQTQIRGISSVFQPHELEYGEIRHEEQIGNEGTKLALTASSIVTHPGARLEPLEIEGQQRTYSAGVTHPFLRSRQENLFGNAAITVKNVDVSALSTHLYDDHIREATVGGAYDFVDRTQAVNRLEANVTKGFGFDTDSDLGRSRLGGQPSFWKFNAEVSRIQPIVGPFSVFGALTGQYSLDPLLASEEFALGGPSFGSAYDPAEITGDSGAAARAELQYNGQWSNGFLPTYQLYTFYDIGAVYNRNIQQQSEQNSQSIESLGLGARFNLLDVFSGSAEFAVPMTKNVTAFGDDTGPRFFFSLQYRY